MLLQRGLYRVAGLLLSVMFVCGLLGFWCGVSFAGVSVRQVRSGETPFIQVEEFVPGVSGVSADVYAFVEDLPARPTTSVLQYVSAADYEPLAADPYAAGVEVSLGTTSISAAELHAHVVLESDGVYHYRIVASNAEGSFETPDGTVETYPASKGILPDGRAYEQVSPVDKNDIDALGIGQGMTMQAAPSGSAFAFFSFEPFPIASGTASLYTDYVSGRSSSPAAWSTRGVQAAIEPTAGSGANEVAGFTEDLSRTIVQVKGPPLGASGVVNAYLRDNTTGEYQLLAPNVGSEPIIFVAASRDDSQILFETEHQLSVSGPAPVVGKTNLYEWNEAKPEGERVSLAGVLPGTECGCAPLDGSGAGMGGGEHQPQARQPYFQDTISEDGSRVFFTAYPSGRVYEREPLSEPAPVTVAVSAGAATFLAATPSGRYVFYSEGDELYRFDTATEAREEVTSGAEGVLGDLGVSDDGTYAYFVADGVLDTNENANGESATKGAGNLYEWHEDSVTGTVAFTFIARLQQAQATFGKPGDQNDWIGMNLGGTSDEEGRTSRVNPAGTALLFMSRESLTGYHNGEPKSSACNEGNIQVPCNEVFLYSVGGSSSSSGGLVCVSCNPSGAAAVSSAYLAYGEGEVSLKGPVWTPHLTRNLSVSGDRVFFETAESLVPGDSNGVTDVYEWEREGVGSCSSGSGHCLYLISTGTAHAKSFFGDASESGDDVFFFTRQPLVGQDDDLNFDVYDARVGGGIGAQNPSVDHCEGEGCMPGKLQVPVSGSPGSIVLTGVGNQASKLEPGGGPVECKKGWVLTHGRCVEIKCAKGKKLSHGKCIKTKSKKKKKARRIAKRHAERKR